VLDIETGRAIADVLDDNPAVFLQNHGSVIIGRSLREAAVLAQVLERACRLQILAASTGAAYHVSSEADVAKKREFIYSDTAVKSYWDYCVRLVKQLWKESELW
jgi:L-fuculose-phosphate aldolase